MEEHRVTASERAWLGLGLGLDPNPIPNPIPNPNPNLAGRPPSLSLTLTLTWRVGPTRKPVEARESRLPRLYLSAKGSGLPSTSCVKESSDDVIGLP